MLYTVLFHATLPTIKLLVRRPSPELNWRYVSCASPVICECPCKLKLANQHSQVMAYSDIHSSCWSPTQMLLHRKQLSSTMMGFIHKKEHDSSLLAVGICAIGSPNPMCYCSSIDNLHLSHFNCYRRFWMSKHDTSCKNPVPQMAPHPA